LTAKNSQGGKFPVLGKLSATFRLSIALTARSERMTRWWTRSTNIVSGINIVFSIAELGWYLHYHPRSNGLSPPSPEAVRAFQFGGTVTNVLGGVFVSWQLIDLGARAFALIRTGRCRAIWRRWTSLERSIFVFTAGARLAGLVFYVLGERGVGGEDVCHGLAVAGWTVGAASTVLGWLGMLLMLRGGATKVGGAAGRTWHSFETVIFNRGPKVGGPWLHCLALSGRMDFRV
jgi:hypothetical protein